MSSESPLESFRRLRFALGIALSLTTAIAVGFWMVAADEDEHAAAPPSLLTISMPVQISAGALYVAEKEGLFAKHRLDVALQRHLIGKQALQAVLDGRADLALVADTPFMLAVLRGERIAVLATVFESRKTMAILARKDRGIGAANMLAAKTIGTVAGTNAEFFLDSMLDVHGIARDAVKIVALKPEQLIPAFQSGRVDAVTVWNPDLAKLEQAFGSHAVTIYGEDLFIYRFLLVGKISFIDSHQRQMRQVLAAVAEGNASIKARPDQARALLGKELGMAPALLARSFDPGDFCLTLDQPLLLTLSDQARWAGEKNSPEHTTKPNFLDYIRAAPLDAVTPDSNKIIR